MKIYVSSTYQDLREHRAAVDRVLRKMGHDVIGMEQYVAANMTPLRQCLQDVRSADAYLIIVAWRYGHIVKPEKANPRRLSITHLELEEAKRASVRILAFLADPDGPWPTSQIDALSTTGGRKVEKLRRTLGTHYLTGMFRSPDDLASEVTTAVGRLGVNMQMVERRLTQSTVPDPMKGFAEGDPIEDTTVGEIVRMIHDVGQDPTLLVDLDDGRRWWSTRLYLLAVLAQTTTALRQMVFTRAVTPAGGAQDQIPRGIEFVGMATPAAVRDGLCSANPEIGAFDAQLRTRNLRKPRDFLSNWTQVENEKEIKVWVRAHLLRMWVGERMVDRCIDIDPDLGLTMVDIRQIVESFIPYVPVRRFANPGTSDSVAELMIIDRDAFALDLARDWVRSGLPRAPVLG